MTQLKLLKFRANWRLDAQKEGGVYPKKLGEAQRTKEGGGGCPKIKGGGGGGVLIIFRGNYFWGVKNFWGGKNFLEGGKFSKIPNFSIES